jgi:hypothetical protein
LQKNFVSYEKRLPDRQNPTGFTGSRIAFCVVIQELKTLTMGKRKRGD